MVTDHSSIGFEFCLLDRPLLVFDAPDLARAARINPEKMQLLRSAARVVSDAAEVGAAATEENEHREHLSAERHAVVRHKPFLNEAQLEFSPHGRQGGKVRICQLEGPPRLVVVA